MRISTSPKHGLDICICMSVSMGIWVRVERHVEHLGHSDTLHMGTSGRTRVTRIGKHIPQRLAGRCRYKTRPKTRFHASPP